MKKSITTFVILMSIGIIILTGVSCTNTEYVTYAILFILLINCIHLTKNIIKTHYKIMTLIELGLIVVSMFIGYTYTALLLTILLSFQLKQSLKRCIKSFLKKEAGCQNEIFKHCSSLPWFIKPLWR